MPLTLVLVTAGLLLPGPLEFLEGHLLCNCAHIQHEVHVQGLVVVVTDECVLVFLRPYPLRLREAVLVGGDCSIPQQVGELSPLITRATFHTSFFHLPELQD